MNPLAPIVVAVGLIVGWANAHVLADLRQVQEQATMVRSTNAHALVDLRVAAEVEAPGVGEAHTPPVQSGPGNVTIPGNATGDAGENPATGGLIEWRPEVERWRPLVAEYFAPADVEHALAIIRCESVGDPDAVNPSSGTAGLFQHRPEFWEARSAAAGWAGASPFDPEANVGVAAWLVYEDGWAHWSGRAWNVDSCEEWAQAQGV